MSFSLIAISDVHLDAPLLFSEKERNKLEELKKSAFKRAIDEAISRNVSVFLICGDLYNESAVCFETLIFIRKCFLELANCNIKICYIHGMEDASVAPDIIRTSNLVDFSHEVETYDIMQNAAPVAKIYASGYKKDTSSILSQFEKKDTNIPTIGLLYEENAFSKQGTFVQETLASKNYDLTILGGYHYYVIVRPESNILYLGSPTGNWFGDRPGGILFAEIKNDGQTTLDKITVSDSSFHDVEIANIVETDINALKRRIEIEIQKTITTTINTFVRVLLTGRCAVSNDITEDMMLTMSNELSKTLDLNVYIQKNKLMPILPKSLFDGTSPLIESLKIVDAAKNDDSKLHKLLKNIESEYKLFCLKNEDNDNKSHSKEILDGLIDTVCKVMIREANYED